MTPPTLPFSAMTDAEVKRALEQHQIGLTVEEARKVEEMLGRPPTLVEATIWGIQGSEHCSYKSSRRFLKQFPTEGKHVILGPREDSGIVAITDGPKRKRWGIVVSHESHNHPSQIVPYEGAATGVGGCVRDVACMGARVIGCLDSLRLGDLKSEESRSIATEVVRGIAGYANPLGIPNLGGDTVFDGAYNRNCLVNVVAIGLVREDEIIHSYVPKEAATAGYDIILVGKPTDQSGFGGAAFASLTISADESEKNTGAVQEPNPFLERHLLIASYALFDWLAAEKKLNQVSFKDLGAGGVVCSTVEQVAASQMGAVIDLDKVHTALPDLPPEVIACAETQERFCWICHPSITQTILTHYNVTWDLPSVAEGASARVIGKVTADEEYRLLHHGQTVCSAKSTDITSGLQYARPLKEIVTTSSEPTILCEGARVRVAGHELSLPEICLHLLAHPTHASKHPVILHYDKNILGATLIESGEADASVIAPLSDLSSHVVEGTHPGWQLLKGDRSIGIALCSGGNGRYGRISPYLQGVNAAVEQMRNVACVGALPRALTDCLNYGNPETPEHLWALSEGVRGIAEAARGVAIDGEPIPIISGNVSLYNATPEGPIDPTAIVCCIGVLSDARRAISMQLRSAGSTLFLVGERRDECGGSAYYQMLEEMVGSPLNALLGTRVPSPEFKTVEREILFMHEVVAKGLVLSSHDISDGGLFTTLFEMTLPRRKRGGVIGLRVDLDLLRSPLSSDRLLFTETGGFVLEVDANQVELLSSLAKCHGIELMALGETADDPSIVITRGGETLIREPLKTLHSRWRTGLEKALQS